MLAHALESTPFTLHGLLCPLGGGPSVDPSRRTRPFPGRRRDMAWQIIMMTKLALRLKYSMFCTAFTILTLVPHLVQAQLLWLACLPLSPLQTVAGDRFPPALLLKILDSFF